MEMIIFLTCRMTEASDGRCYGDGKWVASVYKAFALSVLMKYSEARLSIGFGCLSLLSFIAFVRVFLFSRRFWLISEL